MSKPYKVCADCGAHLDAGETCDCRREPVHIDKNTGERADAEHPAAEKGDEKSRLHYL